MNLGIAPAAMVVLSVISEMVRNRIEAATAAEYAAMQFDYYRRMSDKEITDLVFELSRRYPRYPYWEWYNMVNSLRKYGALEPPQDQQITPPPETGKVSTAAWIVIAVVAALLLMEMR